MKKNKKIGLFIVINLIVLFFTSEWIVVSIGITNYSNASSINSVTANIGGFNAFTKGEVDSLITDEKGTDELIFDYAGGSSEILFGWYYLSLDDYGNCSDFEFSVSLDLDYSGSTIFGQIIFIFGGYYNSQNQSVSYDILPVTHNEKTLLMIGINDTIEEGYYVKGEFYPNDEVEWGMGYFENDNDGDTQFGLVVDREGDRLEYEYSIEYIGGGAGIAPKNMHKILNYIIFIVEIHGSETSNVRARFYNMIADLQCSYLPTTSEISNQIILFYFPGLFMVLMVVLKSKKRKYNLIECLKKLF